MQDRKEEGKKTTQRIHPSDSRVNSSQGSDPVHGKALFTIPETVPGKGN